MKISDALNSVARLGIETAPIIYFIERHPTYVDRMDVIMQRIVAGNLAGVTSMVTLAEVLVHPLRNGQRHLAQQYRQLLLRSRGFHTLTLDAVVSEQAADLRAKYQMKLPDAFQVAAAIHAGCDAFLTNDLGMRRVQEIPVLVLDSLQLDNP